MTQYRLIQWGTGNVGKHALRTILERPDFELVGLRVYNPDKVGKDAGELIGAPTTGVAATDSAEEIVALDADCVAYTPLGSTLDATEQALDDICLLLASGKNVVSSAVEYHAYLRPGVEMKLAGTDAHARMTEACKAGNSTFFHAGINPGFAMELWPLVLSQVCRRIDALTVTEVVDMVRYPSIHMLNYIGFGAPDSGSPMDERLTGGFEKSPYYLAMCAFAEAMGFALEDVSYGREVALAPEPLDIAAGTIEAGTVAAIRFWFEGIVAGRPAITFEWVWRVSDDVAPDWPKGDSRWKVHIEGDPSVDSELKLATSLDAGRAVSLSVATIVLNAVPTVCAAPPGLLNNLTAELHGGGYVLPAGVEPIGSGGAAG